MKILRNDSLTISSTLKSTPRIDGVFFQSIKDHVLGKEYDLSLVFVGKKLGRKLNLKYRKKDYATDILSFTVDKTMGEIFMHPDKARQKAKEFGRTFSNYLIFLFIHGLFHLKGMEHGSRMESEEARVRSRFKV
jgi:rRNA maturation RNase YbeY